MAGEIIGAAVIGSDGRAIGELRDLYVDRGGRVRVAVVTQGRGQILLPWGHLHFGPRGRIVRIAAGGQDIPPPALSAGQMVSLNAIMNTPVSLDGAVTYGRVRGVRIGRDGSVAAVFVKPAAPAEGVYALEWSTLNFHSLPQADPQLAITPEE